MKLKGLVLVFFLNATHGFAQYTQIPDAEFEARLIAQGIDTEGTLDGQVLTDDINHITILDLDSPFPETDPLINDLTGIQDFIALEDLYISSNNIISIDLSNNLNLKLLVCKQNNLKQLDLSNNISLEILDAANCFSGTCDFENTFTSLDLSANSLLKFIFLSNSSTLKELDLSNNMMLDNVGISRNTALNTLNIKNGNNLILDNLTVLDNPLLECVTVDDPVAATEGVLPPYDNWVVEEGIIFSKECILGLDDVFSSLAVNLVPNPTQNYLQIESSEELTFNFTIIYDLAGREVLTEIVMDDSIDVSVLTSGVYFVELHASQGTITKRIIKE